MVNKEKYKNLVEQLVYDYYTFEDFLNFPSEETFYNFEEEVDNFGDGSFRLCAGATKGVIIFEKEDYVIKIPFTSDWNYDCPQEESFVYDDAIKNHLEKFFAPCYFLYKYAESYIYIMEKVYMDSQVVMRSGIREFRKSNSEFDKDDIDIEEYLSCRCADNPVLVRYCFKEFYNDDEIDRLIGFIESNYINDLHESNMGFNKEGKLVLIDYSGI